MLYVQGSTGLADLGQRIDSRFELVREASPTRALARLEADGDFAVVVCDENVNGSPGVELLAAVRIISPTTARVLVSESLARGASPRALAHVFRCLSPHGSPSEWRGALTDALDYHQLLSTCPAQPVEAARSERAALPPPANLGAQPPRSPAPPSVAMPSALSSLVALDAAAPELIMLEPGGRRVGLQVVGRFVELLPGLTVVGRSRTCHIPIPDPQISRRHATFSNTGREVHVRNVSQTNGVRVNGVLIELDDARLLAIGDKIMLGNHEIELCALGDYCPSFEPTQSSLLLDDDPGPEPLSRSSTLITLAQVAEKYFVLGQAREAERILRPLLEGLRRHCESGRAPGEGDVELATDLVLRIAEENHAGEWINYIFELFSVLQRPVPAEQVERLCRVAPESQGVKMSVFRRYLEVLGGVVERLGPKDRFLVRRIQGLEKRLLNSADS
ncbi:MAG TPA: FHA domain-containing protein [Polyangiaceae bacterium]|nr:FHA domain-containing protein [Polyangiaceae bacterium]